MYRPAGTLAEAPTASTVARPAIGSAPSYDEPFRGRDGITTTGFAPSAPASHDADAAPLASRPNSHTLPSTSWA